MAAGSRRHADVVSWLIAPPESLDFSSLGCAAASFRMAAAFRLRQCRHTQKAAGRPPGRSKGERGSLKFLIFLEPRLVFRCMFVVGAAGL